MLYKVAVTLASLVFGFSISAQPYTGNWSTGNARRSW